MIQPIRLRRLALAAGLFCGTALAPCHAEPLETGADQGGAPHAGRAMAQDLCARCHAVEETGDSPLADAPPFRTFSQMWPLHYLEEALAEGIMVGHPLYQMPVFQFTPSEIADLIAYLETIQVDPAPEAQE